MVKNLPANAGDARDAGSIPELGRSPGIGNGHSLQYACLKNSMNRGAWWAIVHGVTKSQTRLSIAPPPVPQRCEKFISKTPLTARFCIRPTGRRHSSETRRPAEG